jgi:hypothetical protein
MGTISVGGGIVQNFASLWISQLCEMVEVKEAKREKRR